jgi:hypothetical protein
MPFSRFPLFGDPFANAGASVQHQIRLRRRQDEDDAEIEVPSPEIDEIERRAAMTRERLRRLGLG